MAHGPPQRQVHGYVSREAFNAGHAFAAAFGVNVTALLEGMADVLADAAGKTEWQLPPALRRAVIEARAVAARRSTRRRDDG